MTTISASRSAVGATPLESLLLGAASAVDDFVAGRVERRGTAAHRRVGETVAAFAAARDAAHARGAIGLLPR